jgi:hypothetical protein
MELQWTHRSTQICRGMTEPFQDVVESDGFPPSPALPRIPVRGGSGGINLNAVTRAIEHLRRSGYRPLRSHPAAQLSRSIPTHSAPGVEADGTPGGA